MISTSIRRRGAELALKLLSWVRCRTFAHPTYLRFVPASAVDKFRLAPPLRGQRRIEIGSGSRPRDGYVHVDVARFPHVEVLSKGVSLPFGDGWAEEILAIHMLEHVPPPRIKDVLAEWYRVLTSGGRLEIHVPNGAVLADALQERGGSDAVWAVQGAVFGYGCGPTERTPAALTGVPDHRILWTFPLLAASLSSAGFGDVRDVSSDRGCHHAEYWQEELGALCLEVVATRP
jgi:hypothetical protein